MSGRYRHARRVVNIERSAGRSYRALPIGGVFHEWRRLALGTSFGFFFGGGRARAPSGTRVIGGAGSAGILTTMSEYLSHGRAYGISWMREGTSSMGDQKQAVKCPDVGRFPIIGISLRRCVFLFHNEFNVFCCVYGDHARTREPFE